MKQKMIWCFLLLFVCLLLPQNAAAQEKHALVMSFVNTGYQLELSAGRDNHYSLELRNFGREALTNIQLDADTIEGWSIEFSPDVVPSLGPGNVRLVDVYFHPTSTTQRRVQHLRIIATSGDYQMIQGYELRIKSAPVVLWVVIGILVVVVAAFILIFVKIGRKQST